MATAPAVQPAFFTLKELSIYLSRSLPTIHRDLACGRIPPGLRIGRARRWPRQEIAEWAEAGMPDAKTWEAMRG